MYIGSSKRQSLEQMHMHITCFVQVQLCTFTIFEWQVCIVPETCGRLSFLNGKAKEELDQLVEILTFCEGTDQKDCIGLVLTFWGIFNFGFLVNTHSHQACWGYDTRSPSMQFPAQTVFPQIYFSRKMLERIFPIIFIFALLFLGVWKNFKPH